MIIDVNVEDNSIFKQDKILIRMHWNIFAVFVKSGLIGDGGQKLDESELLEGELYATVGKFGCYDIRYSKRLYVVPLHGKEFPAEKEALKVAENTKNTGISAFMPYYTYNNEKLRIVYELSARHCESKNKEFTYICRSTSAINLSWSEMIGSIYLVKENALVPDINASLLVSNYFTGSSTSSTTWYRLSPTGKVKKFKHDTFNLFFTNIFR